MRPIDVNQKTYDEILENLYGKWTGKVAPPKFKIGDKVRVSRYKSTFVKGYEMTFDNEIYTIYKVLRGSPTVCKLIDEKDGETIFGRFFEWQLHKVDAPKEEAKTKGFEGPMDKYVIRTKGSK